MASVQHKREKSGDIATDLRAHYARTARVLPWRKPPHSGIFPDSYRVWLSEVMLQQTTVAAVIPYFERFTARWPSFVELAEADEAEVLAAWAGLGYYARARNLIACAKLVHKEFGGKMPDDEAALLRLPGVGAYTAAAIAAFAFGKRAVVVDANVERVVSRLRAIASPLPSAKAEIRAAMDEMTPKEGAGDFAQAMMDLGALICSSRAPKCAVCPLLAHCDAAKAGEAERYPVKPPKKAKPERTGTAYWIERDGKVLLVTRPDKGMLGGMRALPDDGWHAGRDGDEAAPISAKWCFLPETVAHAFTHCSLTLRVAVTRWCEDTAMPDGATWWPINSLDKAGLPTLFAKVSKAAMRHKAGI